MSEENIILKDLVEFMDRNNINSIVRRADGVKFINNKPVTTHKKYTTKELLELSLKYISDDTGYNRSARAMIKRALEEL